MTFGPEPTLFHLKSGQVQEKKNKLPVNSNDAVNNKKKSHKGIRNFLKVVRALVYEFDLLYRPSDPRTSSIPDEISIWLLSRDDHRARLSDLRTNRIPRCRDAPSTSLRSSLPPRRVSYTFVYTT